MIARAAAPAAWLCRTAAFAHPSSSSLLACPQQLARPCVRPAAAPAAAAAAAAGDSPPLYGVPAHPAASRALLLLGWPADFDPAHPRQAIMALNSPAEGPAQRYPAVSRHTTSTAPLQFCSLQRGGVSLRPAGRAAPRLLPHLHCQSTRLHWDHTPGAQGPFWRAPAHPPLAHAWGRKAILPV